ncbi:MAG: hypothetical protein Q7R95_08280 [bacterium]|nr:hypothetical protein [bacterium]
MKTQLDTNVILIKAILAMSSTIYSQDEQEQLAQIVKNKSQTDLLEILSKFSLIIKLQEINDEYKQQTLQESKKIDSEKSSHSIEDIRAKLAQF